MPASNEARLYLTLEEIAQLVEEARADHQRKANQAIIKDDLKQGWGALASMEALESFLYTCRTRAGAFAPVTAEGRARSLEELKRSGLQLVGKRIRKKAGA